MGLVREWGKAHSCTNLDLTCGLESEEGRHRDHPNLDLTCGIRYEEGRWRDPLSEELEERVYLENTLAGYLYQRTGQ